MYDVCFFSHHVSANLLTEYRNFNESNRNLYIVEKKYTTLTNRACVVEKKKKRKLSCV